MQSGLWVPSLSWPANTLNDPYRAYWYAWKFEALQITGSDSQPVPTRSFYLLAVYDGKSSVYFLRKLLLCHPVARLAELYYIGKWEQPGTSAASVFACSSYWSWVVGLTDQLDSTKRSGQNPMDHLHYMGHFYPLVSNFWRKKHLMICSDVWASQYCTMAKQSGVPVASFFC